MGKSLIEMQMNGGPVESASVVVSDGTEEYHEACVSLPFEK